MLNEKNEQRRMIACFAMMGLLADPEEVKCVERNGKRLSCSKSVAVLAVQHANDLLEEIERCELEK